MFFRPAERTALATDVLYDMVSGGLLTERRRGSIVITDRVEREERLFAGAGDISLLCRAVDWGATPLGEPSIWPSSLRTVVRTCLDAATVPMAIWAGREHTLIYNRGYAEFLGASRHPHALGRPAREVWADSWPQLGPQLRRVMEHGECVQFEGTLFPLACCAGNEAELVSYSFVPVRDDRGDVVAALNVIHAAQKCVAAANALVESEERFRTLANNIPQLAWITDETGSIVWYNRRWYEYTGTTLEETRGWGWQKVHHPDHLARVVRKIRHCFAMGEIWEDTFPLRAGTGEYRWFLSRATPIRDAAGNITRWLGTNTDITEQQAAEEALRASETRLRQVADAMPQVVWMAGPDGRIHYLNERVTELAGVRRLDDGTWSWEDVLVPDDRDATLAAWATAVRDGTPYEITHRLKRTDGTVHWYLSRAVPVRDDGNRIVQWFGAATDIESQKQAEEAIRDADRHKTDFLAWLSHELRNPIGIITTSLALIDRAGVASAHAQRALPVINRQVKQVDRLLQDLLDIVRISKGKILLRRESVELNEIVRTAGEDHRQVFEHEGIAFDVTIASQPLRADVDRARIAQAVGNLLLNAAKFTPSGGHVVLSLDAAGHDTAIIEVRDNGAGLAPEILDKVFEPLVQDARTIHRSRGGLGLGLALVKELVELHGGTVTASSGVPDGGAVFTIRLPLE